MAQQVFDKSWPLGKNGASELIPGGAILQTRDGKDEPITLSASFQLGEGGLFLPTDKDNPLEVRVRELEKIIGEIAANPTANTVQARLKALADRLGEAVASPSEHTLLARLAALEEDLGEIKAALESGDAKVTLTGQKGTIGSGVINSENLSVEVDSSTTASGVMIALSPRQGDTPGQLKLLLEHYAEGIGWMSWLGGDGIPVDIWFDSKGPSVFGPYLGFPSFDRGRVRIADRDDLTAINYFKNAVYTVNGYTEADAFGEVGPDGKRYLAYSQEGIEGFFVEVDTGQNVLPDSLTMWGAVSNTTIKDFIFSGSVDGVDWVTLVEGELLNNDTMQDWPIETPSKYRYYRVTAKTNHGSSNTVAFRAIQIYSGTANVAKGKKYTSNYGAVGFDESQDTYFDVSGSNLPIDCVIDVGKNVPPGVLSVWGRSGTSTVKDFILSGSVDGEDWVTLVDGELQNDNTMQNWPIDTTSTFRYYRFQALSNYGSGVVRFHDIRLNSRTEREINVEVWSVL